MSKVLVVEDDPIIQGLLENVVHSIDSMITVECDNTVDEAMERLRHKTSSFTRAGYDLIIADLYTPGTSNGYDLWDLCQRHFPDVPVLITSSTSVFHFLRSIAAKQAESGAPGSVAPPYIEKPMPISRYKQLIEHLLGKESQKTA